MPIEEDWALLNTMTNQPDKVLILCSQGPEAALVILVPSL